MRAKDVTVADMANAANRSEGLMARGPISFRQRDVTRAIRAALAAGITIENVYVEKDGRIVLQLTKGGHGNVTNGKTEPKEIVL